MQYGFGSGVLTALRNDIAGQTPVRFGVLQDVSVDFSADTKELYGQTQYPVDVARGKVKIAGKAKFAQINTKLFNSLYFGQSTSTGSVLFAYNETATIPNATTAVTSALTSAGSAVLTFASAPPGAVNGVNVSGTNIPANTYVLSGGGTTSITLSANVTVGGVASGATITFGPSVAPANVATFFADLGPLYAATAFPFTLATVGAPAVGQYFVNAAGYYCFNTTDALSAIYLNYEYTSSTLGTTLIMPNPLMGTTPRFQATFNQIYEGLTTTLILYSCVASKLTMATKVDDYIIPELDFMAFANAAQNVFELTTSSNG